VKQFSEKMRALIKAKRGLACFAVFLCEKPVVMRVFHHRFCGERLSKTWRFCDWYQ
jgi:hypothetical protein